jgi:hypothetical protein
MIVRKEIFFKIQFCFERLSKFPVHGHYNNFSYKRLPRELCEYFCYVRSEIILSPIWLFVYLLDYEA